MTDTKDHWEHIYKTKNLEEVSWYEPTPATSLDFIKQFNVSKNARIIDVGGGDSLLADNLVNMGYTDVSVLDISEAALNRAKQRLGADANKVKWIVADAAKFVPAEQYDFWHDRAAFHFLTDEQDIRNYIATITRYIKPNGIFLMAIGQLMIFFFICSISPDRPKCILLPGRSVNMQYGNYTI